MKKFACALFLSLALHGLIAAGIAFCLVYAPAPGELARLDLTSVDLSFAETPDETAAAAAPASAPVPPQPPNKPRAPESPSLPDTDPTAQPMTSRPDTTDLPVPDEPHERLETPPAPQPVPQTPLAPAVAPRQARVDALPKPRRNIRPDYPRLARQRGEQGDVTLEIDVNAQGTVDAVRVLTSSGFPLLDEAATKAAHAARFTPAKSAGKPVPSSVRLTLCFKLK